MTKENGSKMKYSCKKNNYQPLVIILYLKDLLRPLLHARPHLVAETPQRVELEDGVDALAGLLVMELCHHHFGHCVGDLHGAQEEHGGWRGFREGGGRTGREMKAGVKRAREREKCER